jgi:hypothetical protein
VGALTSHHPYSPSKPVTGIALSYGCTALVDLGRFFQFLIHTESVGLLGRRISPSQGRCLHTKQHKRRINSHRHPCLECDLNPRSPVFERAKTGFSVDHAATVIARFLNYMAYICAVLFVVRKKKRGNKLLWPLLRRHHRIYLEELYKMTRNFSMSELQTGRHPNTYEATMWLLDAVFRSYFPLSMKKRLVQKLVEMNRVSSTSKFNCPVRCDAKVN